MIKKDEVQEFLEGDDDQKYITNIEVTTYDEQAFVFVNDPENGKEIQKHDFHPFIWMNPNIFEDLLYPNPDEEFAYNDSAFDWYKLNEDSVIQPGYEKVDGTKIKKAQQKKMADKSADYNIYSVTLETEDENGFSPARVKNGFTVLIKTEGKFVDIQNFFKEIGINIYERPYSQYFHRVKPVEQFMIQSGKRLFKGFDDYNQIQKFYFDLETNGIDPSESRIFQIGVRDNKGYNGEGFEEVIEVDGDTEEELRKSERNAINRFFELIEDLDPDIIAGYNSEDFDWPFIRGRCEYLKISYEETNSDVASILTNQHKPRRIRTQNNTLKVGNETEDYIQTHIWGYNILDACHPVKKAKAINSDIKGWGLKYITEFSNANKPNRVYVPGDKIYDTWADEENYYAFNEEDGDWYKLTDDTELKEGYKQVSGQYIIDRYLKDDLWETEKVDDIYSQAAFLIGKLIPTSYMRNCTMGTSGTWQLIMLTWSYKNNLAVPNFEGEKDFPGGLSRMFKVGRAENVIKLDYSALYPRTQLTFDIFPELDISGIMKNLLEYIVNTRDEAKGLKGKYGKKADELEEYLEENEISLEEEEIKRIKSKIEENENNSDFYDKKQLPLKILANSFFGSFGAPKYFPWSKVTSAGETTCRGRQFLRLLASFFYDKGYVPLICDTDGMNFSMPEGVEGHTYIPEGTHNETANNKGETLTGFDADVAEFNEKHMIGYMGLDVDEVADAEINFSKKNYATLIDGKLKKTGNTLKSDSLELYIAEFFDKGLKLLLENKGYEFIQEYYKLIDDIYNYRIPIAKIASKAKIKMSKERYREYIHEHKSDGKKNSRQAWMELVLANDLNVKMGDSVYYYNTGTAKSHGDVDATKNKETGEVEVKLNCKLIPNETIENHPETTVEDYNVPLYIDKLNNRLKTLLVCFDPKIRDEIPIGVKKDRKTKEFFLEERKEFTRKECELVTGHPLKEGQQDDYYEDFMYMEDKEIDFWINEIQGVPNNISEEEWERTKENYHERKRIERENDNIEYGRTFWSYVKRLEIDEINELKQTKDLTQRFKAYFYLNENNELICHKWDDKIADFQDLFTYENEAKEREKFYANNPELIKKYKTPYDAWLVNKINKKLNGHENGEFPLSEDEIVDELKMESDEISAIKSGEKTVTTRKKCLKNGFYRLEDGTIIELDGYYYSSIEDMKNPDGWAKAEGFESLEDAKKNSRYMNTRGFGKGTRSAYIYLINNVFPN